MVSRVFEISSGFSAGIRGGFVEIPDADIQDDEQGYFLSFV